MTVGKDVITFYRGQDAQLNFTMNTSEDITSWNLQFVVMDMEAAEIIANVCVIDDGPNGQFHTILDDTDTDALRVGTYTYTVWRPDAANEKPVAVGDFIVLPHAKVVA